VKRCGVAAGILLAALGISCGKEGPPLPPLVRVPAPPAGLVAERRGESVDITLTVPAANTDGTRPANVQRVDIYAITAPASVTDDQLLKLGTRVGSVDVKAPRDPNATVDPDEPASDAEPPIGKGLDQGATTSFKEVLTSAAERTVELSSSSSNGKATAPQPLAGPALQPASRIYAAVGVSTRGRRGPFSNRAGVPLMPAPAPPSEPQVTYDESGIVVTWSAPQARSPIQKPATEDVLPSRPIGFSFSSTAFNVYEVRDQKETRLTTPASTEARFVDKRIEWGVERCYTVRTVELIDPLSVESEASPARCVTPTDTFSPKAPTGLTAVATEGAINLIWDPNTEADLAGYVVLRAAAPSGTFTPVTPAPIQQANFTDSVQPGVRYVYAVRAIDKAGNASEPSEATDATEAR